MKYRGSSKHKNRPKNEIKGTLCPEWTHKLESKSLPSKMEDHAWSETVAAALFSDSILDSNSRRYATKSGIAFEAKNANDGTWHGYPIPWIHVPEKIKKKWIEENKVTRRQIGREVNSSDIKWALNYE